MSSLAFFSYRYFLAPMAYVLLQIFRPLFNGKLREMIEDKNQNFYKIKLAGSEASIAEARPLWIHAASGEIEYARPILREYKRLHPEVPLLVTYTSPSAKKILTSLHEVDVWAALPWDLSQPLQNFIDRWNPRALLFSRTDVWPQLAHETARRKLPTCLFSATFADNSSRLHGPTRFLTKYTLNQLDQIHCVSDEDRQNLQNLGLRNQILVSGDTRFDQVFHRLENPRPLKGELIPTPEEFIFIAGSTWPEDESHILPAIARVKARGFKSIIAPHEIGEDHLEKLEKQMSSLGLPFVRYSKAQSWPTGTILLIDQIGILAELYTWADIAFIGGSFKKQVHSVMEALAAGLPVMVGPEHRNNREALFYQKKNFSSGMIVQIVHSADDIVVLLERMRKNLDLIPHIKEEIRSEIGKNKNSTQRVLNSLSERLN